MAEITKNHTKSAYQANLTIASRNTYKYSKHLNSHTHKFTTARLDVFIRSNLVL